MRSLKSTASRWHLFSLLASIHGLSPSKNTGSVPSLYKLTSGRRAGGCTNIPHSAARAQENGAILRVGCSGHSASRSVHLDPSELIRPRGLENSADVLSNLFHDRSFDSDASSCIFPNSYKQFAGKRHDGDLSETAAVLGDAILKPMGEHGVWLVA
jgi:hypothetical protein